MFNGPEIEAVMGPRTSYVTMLRDPVEVFESQYSFFGLNGFYGLSLGMIQISSEINHHTIFCRGFCIGSKNWKIVATRR